MTVEFVGSGVTPSRQAAVEEAIAFMPPRLVEHGMEVRIGNEYWQFASPNTSVATVKWDGDKPIVIFKDSGYYWKPIVQSLGPDKRILTISTLGIVVHEFGHVLDRLLPSVTAAFTPEQMQRWSYAQQAWQTEGMPSILGLAYGGQFSLLDADIQQTLFDMTASWPTPPIGWARTAPPPRPVPVEPVPVPGPRSIAVRIPIPLLTLVAKLKSGKVLVALDEIEQAGWGGVHFLAAPRASREAIALAFHDLPEEWDRAALVAELESGHRPEMHNVDGFITNGGLNFLPRPEVIPEGWRVVKEDSRGIFQINVIPAANPWALRTGNLFDPRVNARAARRIYENGKRAKGNGWWHWTTARIHGIESA